MRLLETDATQFDTELLDIYLTEAGEVLDTIAASATAARREFRRSRRHWPSCVADSTR